MSYTIEEIERDWGATGAFPDIIVEAFERSEQILGRDWVESTRQASGGQVRGPGPLLTVVSMGGRLTALGAVKNADKLVAKLKKHDISAEAELTAMHLLYVRNKQAEIEYEPSSRNGRRVDFRIRVIGKDWTYVEVTRPNISEARERLAAILSSITGLVSEIKREFALEVFFRREPDDEEVEGLLDPIRQFCINSSSKRQEVSDLALLILSDVTPRQITPHQEPGDHATPRLYAALAIVGKHEPERHVVASVPYADKRADAFLHDKAAQLPKDHPGMIMVDVSGEPTAFSSWGATLARRFQTGIHTRVSGVCLFAPLLLPLGNRLIWVPCVQLHINPKARLALPCWITESLKDAASDFGTLLKSRGTAQL